MPKPLTTFLFTPTKYAEMVMWNRADPAFCNVVLTGVKQNWAEGNPV
jgi:hypothetical protein